MKSVCANFSHNFESWSRAGRQSVPGAEATGYDVHSLKNGIRASRSVAGETPAVPARSLPLAVLILTAQRIRDRQTQRQPRQTFGHRGQHVAQVMRAEINAAESDERNQEAGDADD